MKLSPKWKYIFCILAMLSDHGYALAQANFVSQPLIAALQDGVAYGALPQGAYMDMVAKKIKAATGSQGEISLIVVRMLKFKQQATCGRISFAPYQESTKTYWGQVGGQINICQDGSPPLRACKNAPSVLVPLDATCADNSRPVDTKEVADAINDAVAKGGLTGEEIHNRLMAAYKKKKPDAEKEAKNAK